jgi:7-cyano-7-deazaguanine synthase in queuosine biosynthesis
LELKEGVKLELLLVLLMKSKVTVAVATVVDVADGTVGENRLYFWNKRNVVTVVAATTAAVVAVAAVIVVTVCKEQRPSCSVATVNRR